MTDPTDSREEVVPVAAWELARHGKRKQPTRLTRRLRHLQYVLIHRPGDRRLIHLIRYVAALGRTEAAPIGPPHLVEFASEDILSPDTDHDTTGA